MSTHRIWHLPADVDTDALAPGAYMQHGIDVIAQHCLENLLPHFAKAVQRGDVIVAGPNFGIGSSREQAAGVLVQLGVAAVIAPSYGGLFFRNAYNLGLPLLTCSAALADQTQLQMNLSRYTLALTDGTPLATDPVPDFLLDMVRAGGLLALLRNRAQTASAKSAEKSVENPASKDSV